MRRAKTNVRSAHSISTDLTGFCDVMRSVADITDCTRSAADA